jgi:hypothetical protein
MAAGECLWCSKEVWINFANGMKYISLLSMACKISDAYVIYNEIVLEITAKY